MALNFPNPALQTPLNEFSPDSTPAKSTNGVTYVWTNNEKWVASSVVFNDIYVNVTGDTMTGQLELPGGGGDTQALQKQEVEALIDTSITAAPYVEVAGDNMTGDLTLGTDKITLNATNGGATFAGRLLCDNAIVGDGTATGTGTLINIRSAVVSNVFTADGNVYFGYEPTTPTNSKIIFNGQNGSAEFAGDIQSTSQNGGQLAGFRNPIINGDFRVWQRGEDQAFTGTTAQNFGPDRWYIRAPSSVGGGATEVKLVRSGSYNKCRLVYNGTPTGSAYLGYRVEAQDIITYAGSTMTLSFELENVNMSSAPTPTVSIIAKNSADANTELVSNTTALTQDGTKYSITFTCDTGDGTWAANTDVGLVILIWINGANPVAANACQLWNVQLEPGPVATPFEHRPIGTELALCQRYFYRHIPAGLSVCFQGTTNTNNTDMQTGTLCDWSSLLQYPVTMRAAPTGSNYTNLGGQNYVAIPGYRAVTGTFNDSAFGFNRATNQCGLLNFKATMGSVTAAQGTSYALEATFSYDLDAEL